MCSQVTEPAFATFGAALLLGLMGSVHCLGMCGGIAGALSQAVPAGRAPSRAVASGLHSLGRIASYSIGGASVGMAGGAFATASGLGVALRIVAGLLILGVGLHLGGWWNGVAAIERVGLRFWRRILPLAQGLGRPDRAWKIFATGMLWGWLPCGLVYSSLAVAGATGSARSGALFMACFGLGTLPALLFASSLTAALHEVMRRRATQRGAAALMLVFGGWTVYGAVAPLLVEAEHHYHPGSPEIAAREAP